MEEITKPTLAIEELKTDKLRRTVDAFNYYDEHNDVLVTQIVPFDVLTAIYYIGDDNVSLVIELETNEIVGFQIEEFEAEFVPQFDNLQKLWKMETSFGKLTVSIREIGKEIVNASEPIIRKRDKRLASIFEKKLQHFAFA